jgi:4-amino-4-deoxy-L-arabinose transferase-like glycosyltransferase
MTSPIKMIQESANTRVQILYYLASAVLFILAFLLRFTRLGGPSLWIDEAFVGWFTGNSWSGLLYTLHLDGGNLPAHFLVVKLITEFLGKSELSLRLFSALSGMLAVVLAMILGWLVGKRPGSLAAGWLWTFSPMAIWYARDAKPYAFSATVALALLIIYASYLRRQRGIYALLAFGLLVIGSFTHYYFFLVIMGLILFSMVEMFQQPLFFRKWFLLSLMALIPLAGWLAWFFSQPNPAVGIGWIERPGLSDIPQTVWNLLSGYGGQFAFQTTVFGVMALLLACAGVCSGKGMTLSRLSFGLGLLAPMAAVWAISQRRPIYMDRYFIVLLPFVTIPVSEGARWTWNTLVQKIPFKSQKILAGLGFAGLTGIGLLAAMQVFSADRYAREDWRGLAQHLSESRESTPRIWMLDPEAVVPFRYYYPGDAAYIDSSQPPECTVPCWYVMRQPYTATHAFAQGVTLPGRTWRPALPAGCSLRDEWKSTSGLELWRVACAGD